MLMLVLFLVVNPSTTIFLSEQLYGQSKIMASSHKIGAQWQMEHLTAEEQEKVKWVHSVLEFANKELGLKTGGSYKSMVVPERWPMIMMVNCCEPFSMREFAYRFRPFFSFPYLGFFNFKRAAKEMEEKKKLGFDVGYGYASGWSMLGIIPDPLFKPWLGKSKAALTELIFHELTHSNIFFKDSSTFNENIASFIGREATLLYIKQQSTDSSLLEAYLLQLQYEDSLESFAFRTINQLSVFYRSIESLPKAEKLRLKEQEYDRIVIRLYQSSWANEEQKKKLAARIRLQKNAFFSTFSSYNSGNKMLKELYRTRFKNQLADFIAHFQTK